MNVWLKKYFSVLLALILIAAAFPAGALAAAYGYTVSVLGVNEIPVRILHIGKSLPKADGIPRR